VGAERKKMIPSASTFSNQVIRFVVEFENGF
jgi:hypothetical protein